MPIQLLVRHVPDNIKEWLGETAYSRRTTINNVVNDILISARHNFQTDQDLFGNHSSFIPSASENMQFNFIDLFAGIGGLRIGIEKAGGKCIFSSEWDKYSQKTYYTWFGEMPAGDITKIDISNIPDHDVLAAGFPCQPFSIAGVSKKISLGRQHGFKDIVQGTLFFQVATIIEIKRPPVVLLENVKNLISHDKGRTWAVIQSTLQELGYTIFYKVIDAIDYVPQHRERIFIVAFDKSIFGANPPFEFPPSPSMAIKKLGDILEENPDPKYTLTDHLWQYLQNYAARHREKGNGFGFGLVGPEQTTRTLSARYHKDGSEILIKQKIGNPRRLTPREAARLMGFPDHLPIVVSDTQAYRQFGNAVVPVITEAIARQIAKVFALYLNQKKACLIKK